MRTLYNILFTVFFVLSSPYYFRRMRRRGNWRRGFHERFARYGVTMTPNNAKQAWFPEGAGIVPNEKGTARGFWIEDDGRIDLAVAAFAMPSATAGVVRRDDLHLEFRPRKGRRPQPLCH